MDKNDVRHLLLDITNVRCLATCRRHSGHWRPSTSYWS